MSGVPRRPFGRAGFAVPALGLGAGHVGGAELAERDVAALIDAALDLGADLIDTARSYGESEARIGRCLAGRRGRAVLSTKIGYGIPGFADWTGACIRAGVDAALQRLGTDVLDVVHLHSCPVEVLARGDVVEALEEAVRAGKVRVAAYSGDNEPLAWAVDSGRFGGVQTSLNLCDQAALRDAVPRAADSGLGVIAKRPLANAPWRFETRPGAPDVAEYWDRFHALGLDPPGMPWEEAAIRFAAYLPGVSACIVGTADPAHLKRAAEAVARGPLPDEVAGAIRAAFARHGGAWRGQV